MQRTITTLERGREKRERMTEQRRHLTAVLPLGGNNQGNPAVAAQRVTAEQQTDYLP